MRRESRARTEIDGTVSRHDSWLNVRDGAKSFQRFHVAARAGRMLTGEETHCVEMIGNHAAIIRKIAAAEVDLAQVNPEGGPGRAHELFGERLRPLPREMNRAPAA